MPTSREIFRDQNAREWEHLLQHLFPHGIPTQACWTGVDNVVAMLRHMSTSRCVIRMLLPDGGWLNLEGVQHSHEEGLLEFRFGGSTRVCAVSEFTFESFDDPADYQWNYFRLDILPLADTGVVSLKPGATTERLTEISPGVYSPGSDWDDQGERPLPGSARLITRMLQGSIVFFQAASAYTWLPDSMDALHNRVSRQQFRHDIVAPLRQACQESGVE